MTPITCLEEAHHHSSNHQDEILASAMCGCFYCLRIFPVSDITEDCWYQEWKGGYTVRCPHCGIDSVIGDSCGVPVIPEFLQHMKDYWFSELYELESFEK